ncbi:hypothetical protein [uncultured Endozoicomonas sp.]|uniref:hypothetical protein n=1 Tax=uncultured Endozoicomonas sp. TaxID=432652 RepID=UPI00262BEB7D|nr:hypothetical protein [uncultured Endozoicomonas sp.]
MDSVIARSLNFIPLAPIEGGVGNSSSKRNKSIACQFCGHSVYACASGEGLVSSVPDESVKLLNACDLKGREIQELQSRLENTQRCLDAEQATRIEMTKELEGFIALSEILMNSLMHASNNSSKNMGRGSQELNNRSVRNEEEKCSETMCKYIREGKKAVGQLNPLNVTMKEGFIHKLSIIESGCCPKKNDKATGYIGSNASDDKKRAQDVSEGVVPTGELIKRNNENFRASNTSVAAKVGKNPWV